MSEVIDVEFSEAERERLLAAVRQHLPAFLHRGASEQHDPIGDVKELLNLEPGDLNKVVAVHQCLDERVLSFGDALTRGLRNPITASTRPPEVSQAVRGPVDWGATTRRRSLEAGNPTVFVVRSAERVFDTPENRTLAWLIDRLWAAVQSAGAAAASLEGDPEGRGWFARVAGLGVQLRQARRVHWLRGVAPKPPRPRTLSRLRQARQRFYAQHVLQAAESVLALRDPSPEALTDVLCQRYFRPRETWRLFEVFVALHLARAFAGRSGQPRKARLLTGSGRAAYARYQLDDGDQVSLLYQSWPDQPGTGIRQATAKRHGFQPGPSRPDLFIHRTGSHPDCAVLELKATYSAGYLGAGLSQLLGYLAERPDLWMAKPQGWLVAPGSATFDEGSPESTEPLWVVSAETVAERAVERFA